MSLERSTFLFRNVLAISLLISSGQIRAQHSEGAPSSSKSNEQFKNDTVNFALNFIYSKGCHYEQEVLNFTHLILKDHDYGEGDAFRNKHLALQKNFASIASGYCSRKYIDASFRASTPEAIKNDTVRENCFEKLMGEGPAGENKRGLMRVYLDELQKYSQTPEKDRNDEVLEKAFTAVKDLEIAETDDMQKASKKVNGCLETVADVAKTFNFSAIKGLLSQYGHEIEDGKDSGDSSPRSLASADEQDEDGGDDYYKDADYSELPVSEGLLKMYKLDVLEGHSEKELGVPEEMLKVAEKKYDDLIQDYKKKHSLSEEDSVPKNVRDDAHATSHARIRDLQLKTLKEWTYRTTGTLFCNKNEDNENSNTLEDAFWFNGTRLAWLGENNNPETYYRDKDEAENLERLQDSIRGLMDDERKQDKALMTQVQAWIFSTGKLWSQHFNTYWKFEESNDNNHAPNKLAFIKHLRGLVELMKESKASGEDPMLALEPYVETGGITPNTVHLANIMYNGLEEAKRLSGLLNENCSREKYFFDMPDPPPLNSRAHIEDFIERDFSKIGGVNATLRMKLHHNGGKWAKKALECPEGYNKKLCFNTSDGKPMTFIHFPGHAMNQWRRHGFEATKPGKDYAQPRSIVHEGHENMDAHLYAMYLQTKCGKMDEKRIQFSHYPTELKYGHYDMVGKANPLIPEAFNGPVYGPMKEKIASGHGQTTTRIKQLQEKYPGPKYWLSFHANSGNDNKDHEAFQDYAKNNSLSSKARNLLGPDGPFIVFPSNFRNANNSLNKHGQDIKDSMRSSMAPLYSGGTTPFHKNIYRDLGFFNQTTDYNSSRFMKGENVFMLIEAFQMNGQEDAVRVRNENRLSNIDSPLIVVEKKSARTNDKFLRQQVHRGEEMVDGMVLSPTTMLAVQGWYKAFAKKYACD